MKKAPAKKKSAGKVPGIKTDKHVFQKKPLPADPHTEAYDKNSKPKATGSAKHTSVAKRVSPKKKR